MVRIRTLHDLQDLLTQQCIAADGRRVLVIGKCLRTVQGLSIFKSKNVRFHGKPCNSLGSSKSTTFAVRSPKSMSKSSRLFSPFIGSFRRTYSYFKRQCNVVNEFLKWKYKKPIKSPYALLLVWRTHWFLIGVVVASGNFVISTRQNTFTFCFHRQRSHYWGGLHEFVKYHIFKL